MHTEIILTNNIGNFETQTSFDWSINFKVEKNFWNAKIQLVKFDCFHFSKNIINVLIFQSEKKENFKRVLNSMHGYLTYR
jgi:hypothetical protein